MPAEAPLAEGRTAEVFAWGEGRVLKLFRAGWDMGAGAREATLARAIYAAGVPAPRVDEVVEVDGRSGVVYERVVGPSLLDMLLARPWRLVAVARTLGEVHAAINQRTVAGLPTLHDALTHRIHAAPGLPAAHRQAALAALGTLTAAPGVARALCHGDYHPGNVLLSARGPLVIDWENAAIGDPLADVARTLLLIRTSTLEIRSAAGRATRSAAIKVLNARYLRCYGELRPFDPTRLAAWELPVTAARLAEEIAAERDHLLARVAQLVTNQRS